MVTKSTEISASLVIINEIIKLPWITIGDIKERERSIKKENNGNLKEETENI